MVRYGLFGAFLAAMASPVWASSSTFLLDHADLIVLLVAIVGLVIGRQSSRRPPVDPRP